MSRGLIHPSRRRLLAWLDSGDPDIEAHIDTCERCASKIEALSQPTPPLSEALIAMLQPPPDLQPRLRTGIARKLQAQDDLEFVLGFLGLPWKTVQAISAWGEEDSVDRA